MTSKRYNGSLFSLIIFSLITGLITLALFAKTLPLIASKTLYFCQQFISNTLLEVPKSFPNTIVFALGAALLFGTLSFLIQLWKTRKLVNELLAKQVKIPGKVKNILVPISLSDKVYVIKDENLFSFCFGILSPHIIITASLINSLNNKELEAVLLHEQAHLQNYDPLKMVFGKTIASMFFFLPIFRELNKNMITANELLADNWTIQRQQTTTFIKGAMRKILATPQVAIAGVPTISHPDSLEVRIYRLVNPSIKHNFYLSWGSIITTILFLALGLFLLQAPVNAFQSEHSSESSYFLCSGDNMCRQQCHHNTQMSPVASPEDLFSFSTPKYEVPSYK